MRIANLDTTKLEGNKTNCPHCGQMTLAESRTCP